MLLTFASWRHRPSPRWMVSRGGRHSLGSSRLRPRRLYIPVARSQAIQTINALFPISGAVLVADGKATEREPSPGTASRADACCTMHATGGDQPQVGSDLLQGHVGRDGSTPTPPQARPTGKRRRHPLLVVSVEGGAAGCGSRGSKLQPGSTVGRRPLPGAAPGGPGSCVGAGLPSSQLPLLGGLHAESLG